MPELSLNLIEEKVCVGGGEGGGTMALTHFDSFQLAFNVSFLLGEGQLEGNTQAAKTANGFGKQNKKGFCFLKLAFPRAA